MLASYVLPDRSAAPYSVSWDETCQVVWVVNSNSDAIYRLDPETGKSQVLPLPRPMAYLRQVSVDEATGKLVATATFQRVRGRHSA